MNNITCIFRTCSGSLFQRQLHCLPKHWSKRAFTAGQSVFVQAQHQQASNPGQPNVTTAKSEGDVDGSALQRLQKLQSKQKRLLEEPEETGPHVIYTGGLTSQMRSLKILSFTTSSMGLIMMPLLYEQSTSGGISTAGIVAGAAIAGFFTFGTPFLIHILAKKYITEIVYDPASATYKAATFSFFLQKKEMTFKADDVVVPDVPGPFTTFTVKTKDGKVIPYFVAPEAFVKISHYGKLMGYDKPIDFHLTINKVSGISEKKSGGLSSR